MEVEPPAVDFDPDQPFEAVQDVALITDNQVIVEALPLTTDVGEAVRVKSGAGGAT